MRLLPLFCVEGGRGWCCPRNPDGVAGAVDGVVLVGFFAVLVVWCGGS